MTSFDRMFSIMETLSFHGSWFPAFLALFCTIYVIGRFVVFRNWDPKHRPDASSCFISLFHGTPAVVLAVSAIVSHPARGLAAPNPNPHNLVLDFSIAYFAVDLLHFLVLVPGDRLFIAHHLATLFVFVTCRYAVRHGAFAILVLLVLAEVTSFCQNVWTLAGLRRAESSFAEDMYRALSPPFYVVYTLARVVAGPWFFCKMSAFYLSGSGGNAIPKWAAVLWIVVVGVAIAVSVLWISNRWAEFFRDRKGEGDKKEK